MENFKTKKVLIPKLQYTKGAFHTLVVIRTLGLSSTNTMMLAHLGVKNLVAMKTTSLNPVPNAQVCIWPFWSDIDTRSPWGRACLS